ncbi:MAG: hypothetical protein AAF957_21510 [Planctomycetota bacterium]
MLERIATTLTLTLVCAASTACGGLSDSNFTASGASAESDGYGVTGGGVRSAAGEPTVFYGTVSERGARRYTYLVIARGLDSLGEQPSRSVGGTSTATGDRLESEHVLTVDDVQLAATFSATVGDAGLVDAVTRLGGEPVESGQWLFVFDGDDPSAGFQPVEAPAPDVPHDLARLDGFTRRLVGELARGNESVRAALR